MLPAKFGSIWPSSFRGEDFFNNSQSETRIGLGTITKNYIIIILFEKFIMKKECQYCHHLNT
jgi:hypothetical protein